MSLRRMETVHAIEVYAGERGYVCIKQDDVLGDTQDVVAMLPQQIPTIVKWLTECAAEIETHNRAENAAALRLVSTTSMGDSATPAD